MPVAVNLLGLLLRAAEWADILLHQTTTIATVFFLLLFVLFVCLFAKGTKNTNNNKQVQTTTTTMPNDAGLLLPAANSLLWLNVSGLLLGGGDT